LVAKLVEAADVADTYDQDTVSLDGLRPAGKNWTGL
jgi:hypothetical protein